MIKRNIKRALRYLGYEIHRISHFSNDRRRVPTLEPSLLEPIWPLPRRSDGFSDEEIHREFAKYELWHYAYEFEGGLSFSTHHNNPEPPGVDDPDRPLQRFRHFMPYLVDLNNGTLQGKRILDIACNSGFWSIQCALLGAEVVGFDARIDLIEQANIIKGIVSAENVEFKVLDFWDMSPQSLGGTFDIVLNLGILYHLPKPLEALELTKSMAREHILLDTTVYRTNRAAVAFKWEEPVDIRKASSAGICGNPSKGAINLMLRHIGVADWFEIPIRTPDMPDVYLDHKRASWLIKV